MARKSDLPLEPFAQRKSWAPTKVRLVGSNDGENISHEIQITTTVDGTPTMDEPWWMFHEVGADCDLCRVKNG